MKAFGLQLIKSNSFDRLYNNVDNILKQNSINIQKQTTAHALQNMLKVDKWFSLCTVNECAKVSNIIIPQDRLDIYRAIHCIHWSEMTPEYREIIIAMVLDDFRNILNPEKKDPTITLNV